MEIILKFSQMPMERFKELVEWLDKVTFHNSQSRSRRSPLERGCLSEDRRPESIQDSEGRCSSMKGLIR